MTEGENMELGAWIARSALDGAAETDLLEGLCERLNAAGVRIMRAAIGGNLLDPVFESRGLRWARGAGGIEETFAREADPTVNEDWARRPPRQTGFYFQSSSCNTRHVSRAAVRRLERVQRSLEELRRSYGTKLLTRGKSLRRRRSTAGRLSATVGSL